MTLDSVHYSLQDQVATIRIDDGKRNALSPQVLYEIYQALDRAESDRATVILTGRESVFSAGFDLKQLAAGADSMRRLVEGGARMLTRSPGFTTVATLSLAMGIGVNTTIFTFVNALLLRPLPGSEPQELASVYTSDSSGPLYGASSYPDYVDFRDRNDTFDDLLAFSMTPMVLTSDEAP